jgi:hypothetical protein
MLRSPLELQAFYHSHTSESEQRDHSVNEEHFLNCWTEVKQPSVQPTFLRLAANGSEADFTDGSTVLHASIPAVALAGTTKRRTAWFREQDNDGVFPGGEHPVSAPCL